MNRHLSDEQWAAAVLNESDKAALQHLAECASCRKEMETFADVASAAREQICRAADQPEAFWRKQREAISARLTSRNFIHPWRRWVWVTAIVVLVAIASTVHSRHGTPPVKTVAQPDPDDALLLSVQQSIQSDLPQALRPAALITREMDRAAAMRRNP